MPARTTHVMACPPELRAGAVRHLHRHLPADQQAGLLEALERSDAGSDRAFEGMLVAVTADKTAGERSIEGVAWVQVLPGNTALVWPPGSDSPALTDLLLEAGGFIDQRNIALTQIVVADQDGYSAELMAEAGFPKLADLLYMFADLTAAQIPRPSWSAADDDSQGVEFEGLVFRPRAGDDPDRLWATLDRTYAGTHDCAALDRVRTMAEVLEGYRAQGEYLPEQWRLVQRDSADVGALLLAAHPQTGNWEVMYMGVAAEARGHGIGGKIARFALDAAAQGGAERLVLAVDAGNEPAIALYRSAGFVEWDRRTVYARLQEPRDAR